MIDKKLQFDLNIADPKVVLENIIEKAGYHKYAAYTDSADVYVVKTEETANSKEDIFKFIETIGNLTGLTFEIVDEDLIDEDQEVHFHSTDCKFGGIIMFGGMRENGCVHDIEDTRFQIGYSEDGEIFA